jgi:VanZ family protein
MSRSPLKYLPVVPLAYMLAIFGLSSIPGIGMEDAPAPQRLIEWVPPQLQNLLHIPLFAGLAFVWQRFLRGHMRPAPATIIAFVAAFSYGVVDELHQTFVPGRFGSLTDVVINALGAGIGALIATRWGAAVSRLKREERR